VYGRLVAEHTDPIEKKPLFHFLPGSRSYSVATVGCNFSCQHCQNYRISRYPSIHQGRISGSRFTPDQVVEAAEQSGCQSISYTYVEPTIFYEFARDCMELAHERGLANIFVSNGYMTPECCRELAPLLDGINIDIKAFSDEFYRTVCKASLQPVLDTVRLLRELGVWVEVTTLVIPGLNDTAEELRNIAAFISSVDQAIPWHVSGFHPKYKMKNREATSPASLDAARRIGLDMGLRYVYEGNVRTDNGESTFCPTCRAELISRSGFLVRSNRLDNGRCPSCGKHIEGCWQFPTEPLNDCD
jgi:pyruvate formate lyase activating enzyme